MLILVTEAFANCLAGTFYGFWQADRKWTMDAGRTPAKFKNVMY